jgi:phosphoenolpyruvate carboxylase
VLNLLQADIMRKLNQGKIKGKNRKILIDAVLVTVAGIAAAMKNTG